MQLRELVLALKEERDAMLASYTAPEPTTYVGTLLRKAELSEAQHKHVVAALDTALTDAFYTILLGLDGAAALGPDQQAYRIHDERGRLVSAGGGEMEAIAYEVFHGG